MSYSKFVLENPGLDNFLKFYSYKLDTESEHLKLWQEFYQAVRDPSWPECASPEHIKFLPTYIQTEISQSYTPPNFAAPYCAGQLVEWLSKTYYDNFSQEISILGATPVMELGQYINGEYEKLIDICQNKLGWKWNSSRSKMFHNRVIDVNSVYLLWLDSIKAATTSVINNSSVNKKFDLWEQALIIAKACQFLGQDPHIINWNDISCNADENNLYLTNFTRTYHGKTI
jgi:hypothetical protein